MMSALRRYVRGSLVVGVCALSSACIKSGTLSATVEDTAETSSITTTQTGTPSLSLSSASTLAVNTCLPVTIVIPTGTPAMTVSLAWAESGGSNSSGTGNYFTGAGCSTAITGGLLSVAAGVTSYGLFFRPTIVGTITMSVSSSGMTSGSRSLAVTAAAPILSNVSPHSIWHLVGGLITLSGTGFQSGASVTVGGSSCSGVSFVNSTTLTCTAPTSTSYGNVAVTVSNPDSQTATMSAGNPSGLAYNNTGTWITRSSAPMVRATRGVWTGSKLIVWGGEGAGGAHQSSGAIYDPATDSWTAMAAGNGNLGARSGHSVVWAPEVGKMIIFGAQNVYNSYPFLYDPVADTWTEGSNVGAPSPRYNHHAAWSGTRMMVWGGYNGYFLANGGLYDPTTNSWAPISGEATSYGVAPTSPIRGGEGASVTWIQTPAGGRFFTFGGYYYYSGQYFALPTAGLFDPDTQSWTNVSSPGSTGTPAHGANVQTFWTGSEVLITAGTLQGELYRFNPVGNSWSQLASSGMEASARGVWTGSRILMVGGFGGVLASAFNPADNSWTPLSTSGTPTARRGHSVAWTGTELLVFGGVDTVPAWLNDLSALK